MAPRANWKGFLRLSLVSCPVALYPATSDSEKISFNQINRITGHRIKYSRVDADTGEEVPNEDIVKAFKVDTDTYVEVSKEELENVALESTRTIEIDEFVPRSDIDPRYVIRPYYLRPDGKVEHDAFAVIRETIRSMDKVAIGRVVLTSREHIIALEALDKGLMGTLLRYPYEVRSEDEYFDEIQDVKATKDMLDLARHIVDQKSGRFEPDKFEDHYETALVDLINSKRNGKPMTAKARPRGENVVDLMDALRKSIGQGSPAPAKSAKKPSAGQKEMLMPIEGKKGLSSLRRKRRHPKPSGSRPSHRWAGTPGRCRRSNSGHSRPRPLPRLAKRPGAGPSGRSQGLSAWHGGRSDPSSSHAPGIRGWCQPPVGQKSPILRSFESPIAVP
jgi:DNA end-binding protein Ku